MIQFDTVNFLKSNGSKNFNRPFLSKIIMKNSHVLFIFYFNFFEPSNLFKESSL